MVGGYTLIAATMICFKAAAKVKWHVTFARWYQRQTPSIQVNGAAKHVVVAWLVSIFRVEAGSEEAMYRLLIASQTCLKNDPSGIAFQRGIKGCNAYNKPC